MQMLNVLFTAHWCYDHALKNTSVCSHLLLGPLLARFGGSCTFSFTHSHDSYNVSSLLPVKELNTLESSEQLIKYTNRVHWFDSGK